jgi:hypothetical protein
MDEKREERVALCNTIAQTAATMNNPCVRITPMFRLTLDGWAQLFFYVRSVIDKVEEKLKTSIHVDITASKVIRVETQCPPSENGFHEVAPTGEKKEFKSTLLVCIHCGQLFFPTKKTKAEVMEIMKLKKLDPDRLLGSEEELPF